MLGRKKFALFLKNNLGISDRIFFMCDINLHTRSCVFKIQLWHACNTKCDEFFTFQFSWFFFSVFSTLTHCHWRWNQRNMKQTMWKICDRNFNSFILNFLEFSYNVLVWNKALLDSSALLFHKKFFNKWYSFKTF